LKFWHDLKKWRFDVHFDVFCQKSGCDATMPTLTFCSVLRLLQTTWEGEKSGWATVHSPAWR
jgi:hypothetical protein